MGGEGIMNVIFNIFHSGDFIFRYLCDFKIQILPEMESCFK